ncbi:MAG: hypothetical protein U0841_26180 [Chloroflexia bacterium]
MRLFSIAAFRTALVINVLSIFVAVGYFLFIAQYLQLVLGLTLPVAGLWSLPRPQASSSARNWPRASGDASALPWSWASASAWPPSAKLILTQVGATGGLLPLVTAS